MILGFAGDTYFAYPLLWQTLNVTASHPPLTNRSMDYPSAVTHIIRIFNSILKSYEVYRRRLDEPTTTEFLIGGYSWREKRFRTTRIGYSKPKRSFFKDETD